MIYFNHLPGVLVTTIPWEEVEGAETVGAGCKGAGTERTTLFVPPTSVVMTTVFDADGAA